MELAQFREKYFYGLLHNSFLTHQDNWPKYRFGDMEYGDIHIQSQVKFIEFFMDNINDFAFAISLFEDDMSQVIFHELIQYKSLGPMHVKLHTYDIGYVNHVEQMNSNPIGMTLLERDSVSCGKWNLDLYGIDQHGFRALTSRAFALTYFHFKQYFFQKDEVYVGPQLGDVVLDCGSCWGDTALLFAKIVGPKGQVHGFEFVDSNVNIFNKNMQLNPELNRNIRLCRKGVSDATGQMLRFTNNGPGTWLVTQGESIAETITIDDYVRNNNLRSVDYIKMDIEGSEKNALLGAAWTINKFRPKLAISAYHLPQDMFDLPITIKNMFPWYKLYLDHHTTYGEETVVYAVAGDK